MAMQPYPLRYEGAGVDILGRIILGGILTFLTFGIYAPWAINGLVKYVCGKVRAANSSSGRDVSVDYTGTGVDLFGRFILWYILLLITLGLYGPWMANGFYRYVVENITVNVTEVHET